MNAHAFTYEPGEGGGLARCRCDWAEPVSSRAVARQEYRQHRFDVHESERVPVRLAAYASPVLDEGITINVPRSWVERVRYLGRFTCYGPTFHRSIVEHLRDINGLVAQGYSALAYDHLLAAEAIAKRVTT